MIGDTDFFIDLMHPGKRHHAQALRRTQELERSGTTIAMTVVTRFQLTTGIELFAEPSQERERVLRLVREYPTYPLDAPAADRAGSIYGSLLARGNPIGILDTLVAAITLQRAEPLLTRNVREYSRVQGLSIETY